MRKTTISRKAPKDHGRMSKAEWAALDAMSEAEVVAAALSDPDNPPMSKAQRARLRPVSQAKKIRWALRLTQEQFAGKFGIPLGTLRDWEQHKVEPDAAARVLLKIIAMEPEVAAKAAKRKVA
jgi:putative transcriptional regulator